MQPDIDKIEAYISGTMDGTERQAFEAELATNPELAEEVDLYRLAGEAVELSISDQLRLQFQEWQEAEVTGAKSDTAKVVKMAPRITLRRVLAIAAGVLLLLTAGSFWYASEQYGADHLALSYYQADPLVGIRGNDVTELQAAVEAIQSGNYAAADEYLETVPETDTHYADARYYLGHSLYQQRRSEDAINVLQVLENNPNSNLKEKAEWLTVLCYLQMKETEDTDFQDLLAKMVADPDHSYHQQAVDMDRKLHSFWYNLVN